MNGIGDQVRAFGRSTVVVSSLLAIGCGSAPPAPQKVAPGGSHDERSWPKDDRSMCGIKGHPEPESSETATLGAIHPNVRRVYQTVGEAEGRHKVLVCREMDTNLDGIKDVVRRFNAKGEPIREEEDSNYDGKIDVWITFAGGRMIEEDLDTKHSGHPDVWKYYVDGKLSRVKRNMHCANGAPDVWEIYTQGRLERIGTADTCEGHVDKWERDTVRAAEEARKAEAEAADAGAADGGATGDAAVPAVTDGGTASSSDASHRPSSKP